MGSECILDRSKTTSEGRDKEMDEMDEMEGGKTDLKAMRTVRCACRDVHDSL